MSLLHNELQKTPELLGGLKKAVGFEAGDGVVRLGETLTPILDIWRMPEWAILRGEVLWHFTAFQAAVAASTGFVGVGLPVSSPFILTLEYADGTPQANSQLELQLVTRAQAVAGGLAQGNIALNRDTRVQTDKTLEDLFLKQIETWTGTNAASLGTIREVQQATSTLVAYMRTLPIVIKPGGVALLQMSVVNTAVQTNFAGRLRASLQTEVF